jgi:hypothetical protein
MARSCCASAARTSAARASIIVLLKDGSSPSCTAAKVSMACACRRMGRRPKTVVSRVLGSASGGNTGPSRSSSRRKCARADSLGGAAASASPTAESSRPSSVDAPAVSAPMASSSLALTSEADCGGGHSRRRRLKQPRRVAFDDVDGEELLRERGAYQRGKSVDHHAAQGREFAILHGGKSLDGLRLQAHRAGGRKLCSAASMDRPRTLRHRRQAAPAAAGSALAPIRSGGAAAASASRAAESSSPVLCRRAGRRRPDGVEQLGAEFRGHSRGSFPAAPPAAASPR